MKKCLFCIVMLCYNLAVLAQTNYLQEGLTANEEHRYEEALVAFRKGAEANDKYCCGRLAAMYLYGLGVEQNLSEAKRWGLKGYQLGNSYSAGILGWAYCMENKTEQALPYLVFSYDAEDAEKENAQLYANMALTIICTMLEKNRITEARAWMVKSLKEYSEYGPLLGQLSYLELTLDNYKDALSYAQKADKLNNLVGTLTLGKCLAYGYGIEKNEIEGFNKVKKAALLDITNAYFDLAELYYNGIGTPINKTEAKKWYEKAAATGDSAAKEKLQLLF